jgi:exosortase E/protease (VPEID-CTERM system)
MSRLWSNLTGPGPLVTRLYILPIVLVVDCLAVASIPHSASLLGVLAPFGIFAYAVFLGLGRRSLDRQIVETPIRWAWFLGHLACFAAVCLICWQVAHASAYATLSTSQKVLLGALLITGIAFLALTLMPISAWTRLIRLTQNLWLYAILAGTVASLLRRPLQSLWSDSSNLFGHGLQVATFQAVQRVLPIFLSDVTVDPARFLIGTHRFAVVIAGACSGMEGLGLVLVFTTIWLAYFRRECRFPHALLLVPCALVAVWCLNILRISALVLIGNAGQPEIAMVGFHSQAGWIAFTAVAFAFSLVASKLSWVRRTPMSMSRPTIATAAPVPIQAGESPAARAYLLPFLAILAAAYVSKSASGHFEWLYPLRFVAALVALWWYRTELRKVDWRFGWLAPVGGAAVFLIWIVPSFWLGHSAVSTSALATGLAGLSPGARLTWLIFRVAAATLTVPIAEELAFRGYLARRILDREFDSVAFSRLNLLPIAVSSIAFGLMHGQQWFVGIVAGLVFAGICRWRGRLSDAIVAHATCNLLLAAWVLSRGDWAQW